MITLNRRQVEKVHYRSALGKYLAYDGPAEELDQLLRLEDLTRELLRMMRPFCAQHPEEAPIFPDGGDGPECWECLEAAERRAYADY